MTADELAACFTGPDGRYLCARWGRPIVPVVFGVADATLGVIKGAIEAIAALAGHPVSDTDPELGANHMVFFLRDWSDLTSAPALEGLIDGLAPLVARLAARQALQYRQFRFDEQGGIKAVFTFLRVTPEVEQLAAEDLALDLAARAMLTWAEGAFATLPSLVVKDGASVVNPALAGVIRAAYDPALPVAATDPAHALRLMARVRL